MNAMLSRKNHDQALNISPEADVQALLVMDRWDARMSLDATENSESSLSLSTASPRMPL